MQHERLFLIPAPEMRVLHPQTGQPLPTGGAWVEDDIYWRRRLLDGDVTEGVPPEAVAPAPPSSGGDTPTETATTEPEE